METETEPVVGGRADTTMAAEAVVLFKGIQLQPFNARRLYAANACGLRIFNLSPDQQAKLSAKDGGTYEGAMADMALVLYLCSQPLSTALRALRLPSECVDKAMAWGEANNLIPGHHDFAEGSIAFAQLLAGIFENDAIQEAPPAETELSRGPRKKKGRRSR